jgi:hypothetical protein
MAAMLTESNASDCGCLKTLIYDNPLRMQDDIVGFRLEGNACISFSNGRMRMENTLDEAQGQKANFVLWCDRVFPANIEITWEFWPLREPGLCIVFFAAAGRNGEDLFDPALRPRCGEYESYHHGDINAYHVSYFRRKWEEERSFHTCNLRKSYGFHLVCQGADPIPYAMRLVKLGNSIAFFINGLPVFHFEDGAESPALGGGRVGFRQMAPLCAEYANLKIYGLDG